MDGIYAMYFTGSAGVGHGVFVLKDGVIAGADAIGGVLDGSFQENAEGDLDIAVTMTVPPGASLVTGAVADREPLVQKIKATLPRDFGGGRPIGLNMPTGPVNVIFKRLRALP